MYSPSSASQTTDVERGSQFVETVTVQLQLGRKIEVPVSEDRSGLLWGWTLSHIVHSLAALVDLGEFATFDEAYQLRC
jgi:hypothetical protein